MQCFAWLGGSVAQKIIVLRQATTQALSPVTWISGTATAPSGWRNFDSLVTLLWRGSLRSSLDAWKPETKAHLTMR